MYLFMHYLYVCFYFGVQNSEIKNIFYLFYYYDISRFQKINDWCSCHARLVSTCCHVPLSKF